MYFPLFVKIEFECQLSNLLIYFECTLALTLVVVLPEFFALDMRSETCINLNATVKSCIGAKSVLLTGLLVYFYLCYSSGPKAAKERK